MPKTQPNKVYLIWGFFVSLSIIVLLSLLALYLHKNSDSLNSNQQSQLPEQENEQLENNKKKYNKILDGLEFEINKLKTNNSTETDNNSEEYLLKLQQTLQELKNKRITLSSFYFSISRTGNLEKVREVEDNLAKIDNFISEKQEELNKVIKQKQEITDDSNLFQQIQNPNIEDISDNIQVINGVKHHHYIVSDSEFDYNCNKGYLAIKNACKNVFNDNLEPTLMHKFIKKLNPQYEGWICNTPAFNESNDNPKIKTEIKYPPKDLVGIYFDKGTRFSGNEDNSNDWQKYTFDEVIKETNGAENVYYFWATDDVFSKFLRFYKKQLDEEINFESIKPKCPFFAILLTQEIIENQPKSLTNYTKKFFQSDGKKIDFVTTHNPNGKIIKKEVYNSDGITIDYINEYNENEVVIKQTEYLFNGDISFISELDTTTNRLTTDKWDKQKEYHNLPNRAQG